MSNINVRVVGTANVTQMQGAFGKLEAQVSALNAQLAQMVALQKGVDPTGYERLTKAAAANSKTFRNAAASTGMFEVQQLRLNRATDDYVKALQKQKLSFADMRRQSKIAQAAYKEQLAMQNMVVKQAQSGVVHGKQMLDVTWPREVSAQLNTAGSRLAFFNEQLKSGSRQMINWGKNTQWAGRQLMVGFTMPVAAFGAAAGVMAYQVDKELTRIAKVYDTTAKEGMALEKELMGVREQGLQTAIKAAKEYGAAGTDTLNVQAELAATGLKGVELQKASAEVMRISRLGELEYQDAINTTIALQATFKMSNEELTESFNYMNAVENATSLQTKDFAQAIPIAAGVMKAWGGDVRELGVLLTAMRENGVGAVEGANALKATLQRLTRPSKQVREEWQALTNTDITKIVKESNSLTEVFQKINAATRDLNPNDRKQAFAGLFGSYQVSRLMALTRGMQDLEEGMGQVSTAARIAGQDTTKWAETAEKEIERYRNSISGKWDTAFQEMKLQLSTLGEPFVETATVIIKAVSKIISVFNEAPHWLKITTALVVGFGAIAGPVIMLTGLLYNLFGQGISGAASLLNWISKLMGGMKIMTAEQRAAALAAEQEQIALTKQATAVQMLTMELNKLTLAQQAANRAAMQSNIGGLTQGGMSPGLATATAMGQQLKTAQPFVINNTAQNVAATAAASKATAQSSGKAAQYWQSIGASAGIAAGAMGAMLISNNETVDKFAELVMWGASLGPMLGVLAKGLWKGANSALRLGGGLMTGAKGAGVMSASLSRVVPLLGRAASAFGPAGLVATAAAGIVMLEMKAANYQKEREASHEKVVKAEKEAATVMANASKTYADNTGKALKDLKQIPGVSGFGAGGGNQNALINQYKSSDWKKYMEKFQAGMPNDQGSMFGFNEQYGVESMQSEAYQMAMQRFWELQTRNGLTAKRASKEINAMYLAAGASAAEASAYAKTLLKDYGDLTKGGAKAEAMFKQFSSTVMNSGEGGIEAQAGNLWDIWEDTFMRKAVGTDSAKWMNVLKTQVQTAWNNAFRGLGADMQSALAGEGITTGGQLKNLIRDFQAGSPEAEAIMNRLTRDNDELATSLAQSGETFASFLIKGTRNAAVFENELIKNGKAASGLKGEFTSLDQLFRNGFFKAKIEPVTQDTVNNFKKRVADMKRFAAMGVPGMTPLAMEKERNELLIEMKNRLEANGVSTKKITTYQQAIVAMQRLINGEIGNGKRGIDSAASAAQRLASILGGAFNNLNRADFMSAYQSGMQNVQQSISDDISENFDRQMNSALESRQAMWDGRAEKLQNDIDARGRALDAKWEKKKAAAEAYWDRRIKLVDKAIKAEEKADEKRQKMFDAEIARINKLNEMTNRNIDFNVALNQGQFDEAAKIRNDATAAADAATLEAAKNAGAGRSANRIDRLEGRKDAIETARDKAMKALERQEQAERRHLDKVSKMRQAALERDTKADMDAQRTMWENRKESLNKQLELFMSFIAGNEKQLKKHMERVGLNYDWFERKVIRPKGQAWGDYFGTKLREGIRSAGMKIASDKMWKQLGTQSANELLKGMGFGNMADFRHFVKTGEIRNTAKRGKLKNPAGSETPSGKFIDRHEGGWIDSGGSGSRKGVARTYKGLHPSEQMVRAQKGEYMVNARDARNHHDVLDSINSGNGIPGAGGEGGFAGGVPGVAGVMSGVMMRMFLQGIKTSLADKYQAGMKKARTAGALGAANAGRYGDLYFGADQLRNALTIASVGKKMGMSSRDIQIGIMTAITESMLRNVRYGDRDSQGLFQQRPSQGWGTIAQVTNPSYAATKFFSALKGVGNRGDMSPWMAAQSVQRSAFSDGSNYRQYWDEAKAIFSRGLSKGASAGLVMGAGGRHWPLPRQYRVTRGLHDTNTGFPGVDFAAPTGTPIYSVADGRVTTSKDLGGPGGYYSYGRYVVVDHGGVSSLYAHMSQRFARTGQQIKGGTRIGLVGSTGNSTGPHLHFGASNRNPNSLLSLRKGAANIKWDNTLANLHKGEAVLTEDLNRKFHQGVENFAAGPSNHYNVNVNVAETDANPDEIADAVVKKLERRDARKPRSRRN